MDLVEILAAVADTLAPVIPRCYDWPAPDVSPPAAIVTPGEINPRVTYGTSPRLPVNVRVIVGKPDERAAALTLYDYMGSSGTASVYAAIEADRTLSGTVDDVTVVSIGEPQIFAFGNAPYLGVDFTLDVLASD